MSGTVEREFLEILRKTCRTMRQARNRPEMAIPAAEWEMRINERLVQLERGESEPGRPCDCEKATGKAAGENNGAKRSPEPAALAA